MASVPFAIVDVFSATPFKGNPLAVVDARDANLTDTQMKLLTRQFNLSETTFFMPPTSPEATFKLRSFLPDGREVYGAGHNILGVWWFLAHAGLLDLSAPQLVDTANRTEEFVFRQELGGAIGSLKVIRKRHLPTTGADRAGRFADTLVSIRQVSPGSHAVHPNPTALAASFGLKAEDVGFPSTHLPSGDGPNLPPQVMSTSTTRHLIVPISSVEALNRAVVQRDKLLEQLALVDEKAYGLFLFTPDQGTNTYQARFFSPGMSGEDPATGSAAGPLSAYLYKQGMLKLDRGAGEIVVRQGLQVGRECVITVSLKARGSGEDETLDVDIIGDGVQVASGTISVPEKSTLF